MCNRDFGGGTGRDTVSFSFISLYKSGHISLNTTETQWSYIVDLIAKLCTCNLGPVNLQGGVSKNVIFLGVHHRALIMVLLCRIQDMDVHVPVWSSKDDLGPRKEHNSKFPLPHFKYALLSLFSTKSLFSTNRLHWSDLKGCMKKCCCFWYHFEVNILTRFGIFCLYKILKRLLLRCIHHFKSDLINNMDHMRISGTEPSSVILSQTK